MEITAAYIEESARELRDAFASWAERSRNIKAMLQPRPGHGGGRIMGTELLAKRILSEPQQAVETMTEYVSGRMAIVKQNILGRALALPPKIEPAQLAETPEDQSKERALFQFLHGIQNSFDASVQENTEGTSWARNILQDLLDCGKAASIPFVEDGQDGQAYFEADLLDPLSVWHDFNSWPRRFGRDMVKGAYEVQQDMARFADAGKFEANPAALLKLREANGDLKKTVTVTDFWIADRRKGNRRLHDVYHAILIDGTVAGIYKTDFDHMVPKVQVVHASPGAYTTFTSGMTSSTAQPGSTRGVTEDKVYHHAESVFAPLYYINKHFQQLMSEAMRGVQNVTAFGQDVTIDPEANEPVPNATDVEQGRTIVHGPGVTVRPREVPTAQIAQVIDTIRSQVDAEFHRLAPEVLFGQSNPGDSGYLQVIKVSHAHAVFQETLKGGSAFVKRVNDELLYQFLQTDMVFKVDAWQQVGKMGRQVFPGGDFGKADLPERYIINVQWLADFAENDAAKIEVARAAVDARLISRREAMAHTLDNDDPDRTIALIDQEEYEALPIVKGEKALENRRFEIEAVEARARRERDPALKFELMDMARHLKEGYAAMKAQIFGQMASAGQPSAEGGFSPSTMPPEQGMQNPDQMAAAQGQTSSFTGGRPRAAQGV